MPQNKCPLNETKTYHAQRKRLEKQANNLGKRLKLLRQKEKTIQSQENRDEISKLEREHVEKGACRKGYGVIAYGWDLEAGNKEKEKMPYKI